MDFKAYIQNTNDFKSDTEELNNSSTSITTFGTLIMEKATFISIKLANKAYIHLFMALELTIKSTIKSYIEIDLFAYNTATVIVL